MTRHLARKCLLALCMYTVRKYRGTQVPYHILVQRTNRIAIIVALCTLNTKYTSSLVRLGGRNSLISNMSSHGASYEYILDVNGVSTLYDKVILGYQSALGSEASATSLTVSLSPEGTVPCIRCTGSSPKQRYDIYLRCIEHVTRSVQRGVRCTYNALSITRHLLAERSRKSRIITTMYG